MGDCTHCPCYLLILRKVLEILHLDKSFLLQIWICFEWGLTTVRKGLLLHVWPTKSAWRRLWTNFLQQSNTMESMPDAYKILMIALNRIKFDKEPNNRAWEGNWYIMSPMKNPKRWFFALNMKFSMFRDYTKKISKITPPGKGEKPPKIYRWSELFF